MAKARDIAALAGLAGLAYANRDKLFGGKKTYNEDAGDQKTSSYTGDAKKVESKDGDEGPRRKITDYIQKAPSDVAGSVSSTPATSSAPVTSSAPKVASAKPAVAANEPVGLTTPVSSANRTDQLANLSRAVKREDKTKKDAQDDFRGYTKRTYTSPGPHGSIQEVQKLNDTLEGRAGANTSSARKTDALRVASRAAAAADRQRKMAKQSSYKSGGMTSSASNRADGIATKGKTRGKIC